MHVILSNYRSGSLTFARDYAKDCGEKFLGDPYNSLHPDHILCDSINCALLNNSALPAGVIKLYPHDLCDRTDVLDSLCSRAETIHIISKKSFDDVIRSYAVAERLSTVLNIRYDEPFTIQHKFVIPVAVYNEIFFKILQNTLALIRQYHMNRNRCKLLWYEDIFETHSRTHRPVTVENQLPESGICIQTLFDTFIPKL